MAVAAAEGYWTSRPLDEMKAEIRARAGKKVPFVGAKPEDVERALEHLPSVEHETWAGAWTGVAEPYLERAREAEARGDRDAARDAYLQAWTYFSIARYPCPRSAVKRAAYERGRDAYLAAAPYFEHHFERMELPFHGRAGEGTAVPVYLHRPRGVDRPPVVVMCGGIDQFKEEAHGWAQGYVREGMAVVTYDMPGTGESPVIGSPDAERIYDAILPAVAERPDLDGRRLAVVGRSFGGYWATKVAHTHPQWLRAAVNWGGAVHYGFEREWIVQSRFATSYLFELLETRAHAFGLSTAEEYVEAAPRFSLLDQGVLDRPHAPMLAVNGKDDQQVPIADLYLLLEHGGAKSARVYESGGHLGPRQLADALVRGWVRAELAR